MSRIILPFISTNLLTINVIARDTFHSKWKIEFWIWISSLQFFQDTEWIALPRDEWLSPFICQMSCHVHIACFITKGPQVHTIRIFTWHPINIFSISHVAKDFTAATTTTTTEDGFRPFLSREPKHRSVFQFQFILEFSKNRCF